MVEAHPAHADLPALYGAELTVWKGRWGMIVVAPGPQVVVDRVDLGPADALAAVDPSAPGNVFVGDEWPDILRVPPLESAADVLSTHGYVVAAAAAADPNLWRGWVQVIPEMWTAHCHPSA